MANREESKNKLRVLRSSYKKNPFYKIPSLNRTQIHNTRGANKNSEFNSFTNTDVFESVQKSNDYKNIIKIKFDSPNTTTYKSEITFDRYWLRRHSKNKNYCESSSSSPSASSPEVVCYKSRRKEVEIDRNESRTCKRRHSKIGCINNEASSVATIDHQLNNEVAEERKLDEMRRFRKKSIIESGGTTVNQEPNQTFLNEIGTMKPRKSDFEKNLITSIKHELCETNNIDSFNQRNTSFEKNNDFSYMLTTIKQEPNSSVNAIGLMNQNRNVCSFKRNKDINPLKITIKKEPAETFVNEIGIMDKIGKVRSFEKNNSEGVNPLKITIKKEAGETFVNEIGTMNQNGKFLNFDKIVTENLSIENKINSTPKKNKKGRGCKKKLDFTSDEYSNLSLIKDEVSNKGIMSKPGKGVLKKKQGLTNEVHPVRTMTQEPIDNYEKKLEKVRDFKKKLNFGDDSIPLNDFIKIEYEEENLISNENAKDNKIINCFELNSSNESSYIIEIKSTNYENKNDFREISNLNSEVIFIGETISDLPRINHESLCDIVIKDQIVEKYPVKTKVQMKMQSCIVHEFDDLELHETSDDFLDVDAIEPSVKSYIDPKLLVSIINDLTEGTSVNSETFRTPENTPYNDSVVPDSGNSVCTSPEDSLMEIDIPASNSFIRKENSDICYKITRIGIPKDFLAEENNNNYTEKSLEDVSNNYKEFTEKVDAILLQLTNEKIIPLLSGSSSNLNSLEELELVDEIIREDVETSNVENNKVSISDNNFHCETLNCLEDFVVFDDKYTVNLSSNILDLEMSTSTFYPLDTNSSREQIINYNDEVSKIGNINNKTSLKIINNDNVISTDSDGQKLFSNNPFFNEEVKNRGSNLSNTDIACFETLNTDYTTDLDSLRKPSGKLSKNSLSEVINKNICLNLVDNHKQYSDDENFHKESLKNSPELYNIQNNSQLFKLLNAETFTSNESTKLNIGDSIDMNISPDKDNVNSFKTVYINSNSSDVTKRQDTSNSISKDKDLSELNGSDNEILEVGEKESFASTFACSLQSLYQFERESVSPLVLSQHTTPKSDSSADPVIMNIGDYVSPIPSNIESSFYMSPTIRELNMKPYMKYFDTEKIKNAQDPELEFSKQLGNCTAIDRALNIDFRRRQRLGLAESDAHWQTNFVKRLRMQHRRLEREASRRKRKIKTDLNKKKIFEEEEEKKVDPDYVTNKKAGKKSKYVEIKSPKNRTIAIKKTDQVSKNETKSSLINLVKVAVDVSNSNGPDNLLKSPDFNLNKTENILESSKLLPIDLEVSSTNIQDGVTSNTSSVLIQNKSHVNKTESSSVIPCDTNNLDFKVHNEKTEIKKSLSSFKIPFKSNRKQFSSNSSLERRSVIRKTDNKKTVFTPPYSLLKKTLTLKLDSEKEEEKHVSEEQSYLDWREKLSTSWLHLKKEINRRNPHINLPGALGLLGRSEVAKQNAAFELIAKRVEKQLKSLKPKFERMMKSAELEASEQRKEKNAPNILNIVNVLNNGRNLIFETNENKVIYKRLPNNEKYSIPLPGTDDKENKPIVPTNSDNNKKSKNLILSSLLSTRKDLLWQNCSVLLEHSDWSRNIEAKITIMNAMSSIPVNSSSILSSVTTLKSIIQSSRSENKLVANAALTLLHNLGSVEEILPVLFMSN